MLVKICGITRVEDALAREIHDDTIQAVVALKQRLQLTGKSAKTGSVRDAWSGYGNLRGVKAENEQLRRQLGELQMQVQQERARAERARQLERLLGFQQALKVETVAAGVIGASRPMPPLFM